jgi:predicted CoA-substrate-specific enzyme activase
MTVAPSHNAPASAPERLGLDVGGVFAKVALLDGAGRVLARAAERHHGNPGAALRALLTPMPLAGLRRVGVTGSYAPLIAPRLGVKPVDFVNAEIAAVRPAFPAARNIINVGGSSVTLIQLDEQGAFLDFSANSLCAAGTGAFLDQQAERLGIRYEDLAAFEHHDSPPPIATRCSVFAKTDLIHRQQEGFGKAALWCGLCKSMTGTFLNTLLRGRPLRGQTVLTGGVSRNAEVLRWLKARYGDMVRTFEDAAWSGAIGAALRAQEAPPDLPARLATLDGGAERAAEAGRRPPLQFRKSCYPSFAVAEASVDSLGNELRVTAWPEGPEVGLYIGLDVGSTSTKAVLMDPAGRVLADIYRRTSGDPLDATKRLFAAVQELGRRKSARLRVLGVGATGSGRKLVGQVVGADVIVNEITAHLTGALRVDPRVDTIFEIGGQDSKYIRARNGRIFDSNMNYVCAAGTGSFVEEQARRLGFKLEEIGDVVMDLAPPVTSDRCTVFMEQDVERLLRQGYTREECMAAVLCSVVKNYLNKVVGRRHVNPERIFFQGATARNKGLVAAFENVLGVEVVVSPYCHVMGAYGAALLAEARAQQSDDAGSRFKGLDLASRHIALTSETCTLCQNHCRITSAEIEGQAERPSWGYMCGREPGDSGARVHREFAPFRRRLALLFQDSGARARPRTPPARTIGLPRCLTAYSHLPLWRTLFRELGCKLLLSERTDEEVIRRGAELTAADFCFPVKLAHGHAARLAERKDVDFILLPQMAHAERNPKTTNSSYCPYVQAFPGVARSALGLHGIDPARLLMPIVDFSRSPRAAAREVASALAGPLGLDAARVRRAWHAAAAEQREFDRLRREEGAAFLREVEAAGKPAIVLIGRPYNVLDLGGNLGLPQKIADHGVTVLPMDMLPYDLHAIAPAFRNMYWAYGQHILCAAEFVRNHPNLFAVYFTNFSCGPDSFLLSFVDEIMGEKPSLTLELDEHGGDAGYLTRLQAFLDVVSAWTPKAQAPFRVPMPDPTPETLRARTIWIPPMHPIGGEIYAAAIRSGGLKAEALPPETRPSFDLGRALTRGGECLPAACTTGSFLHLLRERKLDPAEHALFMPSADGPCRFGQYALLQRLVLNRTGCGPAALLSPCAGNAYQGLSQKVRARMWQGLLAADLLWKAACRKRPYELTAGETDRAMEAGVRAVAERIERHGDARPALRDAVRRIAEVPAAPAGTKPLVGIVGEIYVRCNAFCNDDLVRAIEAFGAEAWQAPVTEWVLYTAWLQQWRARRAADLPGIALAYLKNRFLTAMEHEYHDLAAPFLDDRREPAIGEIIGEGARYLPLTFTGESILTLGRAVHFARDGADLIVNVAPFGCMPGTITSALCREIQTNARVPIVSIFYDGEPGVNARLGAFLSALGGPRGR